MKDAGTSKKEKQLIDLFQGLTWEDRYKKVISMGEQLAPMKEAHKIDENLVEGCMSRAWLVAEFKNDKVYFQVDSEAKISKGLASLVVFLYSGQSPDSILSNHFESVLKKLNFQGHLSMNRSQGLLSMFKKARIYAMAFKALKKT